MYSSFKVTKIKIGVIFQNKPISNTHKLNSNMEVVHTYSYTQRQGNTPARIRSTHKYFTYNICIAL